MSGQGATVQSVPVYRWTLPDDIEPLQSAIRATIDDEFDVLLFTSAQQVRHVLEVATTMGLADQWIEAANRLQIGSIGPTCSETLTELTDSIVHHGCCPISIYIRFTTKKLEEG